MIKQLLFITLVTVFSTVIAQNPIEKEGWELTFNDEFNAKRIDYKVWQNYYYWGGRSNKGGITYYGEDQFQFTDSTLRIVSDKEDNKENLPYRSGMIDCNKSFKQQHGYFEIRCKIPSSTGFWPAFWLVSTESWPPEIDVFEFHTNEPKSISTSIHWLNKKREKKRQTKKSKINNASEGFYTYAVEWNQKKIKWFYNGRRMKTSRRGVKSLIYKMHIIISLGVNERKGMILKNAIFPNYFEIDYVRVYKKKD